MDTAAGPFWSSGPIRAAVREGNRGEVVRLARLAHNWTQSELGRRCGYSPSAISRLEKGAQPLNDTRILRALATVLELPPELLGLTPDTQHQGTAARATIPRPRTDSPVESSTPAPAQLPMDIPEFVGREAELRALDALLVTHPRQQPSAVVIAAVSGTAGVGKTVLAVHWAHRVADQFRHGQLYVNLRGFEPSGIAMDPAEAIRGFLEALGVEPKGIPSDLDARAALYRSLLSGKRMLIVLDNARDANQVRHLLPGAPGCLVVVTSRSTLSGLVTREGARPMSIDLLTDAEAKQLLKRRLGPERIAAEPAAVDLIVTACAGLPLALAVVAARAKTHPEFSLASLAVELQDRLEFLSTEEPDDDVRAVFSCSYDQLGDGAKRMFRLFGLHPGPDASAAAIASLIGLPLRLTRALLTVLIRAHLVSERTRGRFELHDLLRAYAYELVQSVDSPAERQSATRRMLDHYLHTAFAADRCLQPGRETIPFPQPQYGTVVNGPHDSEQAMNWFTTEHRALLAVLKQSSVDGLDADVANLAWSLDTYLDRQGHYRDYAAAWQAALEATTRLGDRPGQARAHRMLAQADLALGRLDDAQQHLHQALRILDDVGDRTGKARTYGALAQVVERYGDIGQALEHARKASDLYLAAGSRDGHARAQNDVGWYLALMGEYEQALTTCEAALAIHQELGNNEAEANTWDSIGLAHHHLGRYERAIDCYRTAVGLFEALGDRRNWASSLACLGDTYLAAGDERAALASWEKALEIYEDLQHPDAEKVRAKLTQHAF